MEELLKQIDQEIAASREALVRDTIALVNIKSVKGEPQPGAPFGPGPRAVLDAVMKMGEEAGLVTTEYTDSVVGLAPAEGQPDLGIWIHGDVVPEGTGWNFEPYNAVEYNGFIIGRGVTDNKGQFCAMFHLMKIFKKLGISLNYLPSIYVGSDEESGAHDVKDFLTKFNPPRVSLIPDCGFPALKGGRGKLTVHLRSQKPLKNLMILAGQPKDPGAAVAVLGGRTIEARTMPGHSARPDAKGNMITRLMEKLLEDSEVAPQDRPVLELFRLLSCDVHGEAFDLNSFSEIMHTTVAAIRIDMVDGCPELQLAIRNQLGLHADVVQQRLEKAAAEHGAVISFMEEVVKPYLLDENWPVLKRLVEVADEITGDHIAPYMLNGYTYGHLLPNAIGYGTDANVSPPDFPAGRGGAHGVDESASVERLQRAMRIYARALLALNEMSW